MGFNINYGPIAAGVLMGARAGQGQFKQKQFENDEQFMGTLNDMQRTEDSRRATDMQNALGYFDANSRNNLANAQLQQTGQFHSAQMGLENSRLRSENAYRQSSLQGLNQYRAGNLDNKQDNTDIKAQRLSDKEDATQQKNDAISQFTPDAQQYLVATGKLPPSMTARQTAGADPIRQLATQLNALKQAKSSLEIPEVDGVLGTKTGKMIPRPGSQGQYNQILGQMQQVANRLGQIQVGQPAGPTANAPRIAPAQVNPQMQAQTAAAASGGMSPAGSGGNMGAQETADFRQLYDSLPNGATYMGPDGQLRMKRQ